MKIEDIMPQSFRIMHRWVYDMDVTLSWDTIFGVLDAARKYMVEAESFLKRQKEGMKGQRGRISEQDNLRVYFV